MSEDMRDVVKRYYTAVLNDRNLKALGDCFAWARGRRGEER